MPLNPHVKQEVIERLVRGESVREISEATKQSVGNIQHIRAEILEGKLNNAIEVMGGMEPSTVMAVAEQLEGQGMDKASKEVKTLTRGIKALQRLQPELIDTATAINRKMQTILLSGVNEKGEALTLGQYQQIANIVRDLNTSFLNPNVANTVVQINTATEDVATAKAERMEKLRELMGQPNKSEVIEAEVADE